MTRITKLAAGLLCMLLSLSCEKNNPEHSILGRWHLVKYEYYDQGVLALEEEGALELGVEIWTFKEFGQLITDENGETHNWHYELDGDRLFTNWLDDHKNTHFIIKTLTKKELILRCGSHIWYFEKVK